LKLSKEIRFFLCVLACAVLLSLVKTDSQSTALLRLESSLQRDGTIPNIISTHCSTLGAMRASGEEQYVVEKLMSTTSRNPSMPRCSVLVESTQHQRFHLQSEWLFALRISSDRDGLLVQRKIPVRFPEPLCLLPFFVMLLAMLAQIQLPRFAWLAPLYLLLLGGFNFIEIIQTLGTSLTTTITTETSLPGFLLIGLWLALLKNQDTASTQTIKPVHTVLHRFLAVLCGIWNPGVFTAFGPLFYPARTTLMRVRPLFDSQIVIAALSLYLFSFEFGNSAAHLQKSLELPRYFSFSLFALYLIRFNSYDHPPRQLIWKLPNFWRATIFIIVMEILSWRFSDLRQFSSLTRIGATLLLSELIWPKNIRWRGAFKASTIWLSAIFVAFWLPTIASQCGICELTLSLSDPRLHPSTYVLFTFVGATLTAFVTGSFSLTLLTFFNIIVTTNHEPAVRAAFLDGVLAGTFLSPFSIYNLLPSAQFNIPLRSVLSNRFRQIRYPLLMAMLIYAVTIPAVMILRPLAFTFLCLVALTLELRRNNWTFRMAGA
jgi:hypothetical protein